MMGPLRIAQASGDAARVGAGQLFFLVAVISLQIGIMNLFPLPPLDGGHLAILAGESILRRDFSMAVKTWIMNAGALVLFLLIGVVLYSDLSKTSLLGRLPALARAGDQPRLRQAGLKPGSSSYALAKCSAASCLPGLFARFGSAIL